MSEDEEERRQLIRRVFTLATIAAEDAAAMAAEGQAPRIDHGKARVLATGLRELGERIEILALVVQEIGVCTVN